MSWSAVETIGGVTHTVSGEKNDGDVRMITTERNGVFFPQADESYTIPPGHDAWVEGNQPFVGIEVMSAEQYAKPTA